MQIHYMGFVAVLILTIVLAVSCANERAMKRDLAKAYMPSPSMPDIAIDSMKEPIRSVDLLAKGDTVIYHRGTYNDTYVVIDIDMRSKEIVLLHGNDSNVRYYFEFSAIGLALNSLGRYANDSYLTFK